MELPPIMDLPKPGYLPALMLNRPGEIMAPHGFAA